MKKNIYQILLIINTLCSNSFAYFSLDRNFLAPISVTIAENKSAFKKKGNINDKELSPGAKQFLKYKVIPYKKLINNENFSKILSVPIGLEIEISRDINKEINKFINWKKVNDDNYAINYYEFNPDPLWSADNNILFIQWLHTKLNENNIFFDDVISVQINAGFPCFINIDKNIYSSFQNLIKDAKTLMLAVVLAYVSNKRISFKKYFKVAGLQTDHLKDLYINGEMQKFLRIEYAFADINNIDVMIKTIQYIHAVICSHNIKKTNKFYVLNKSLKAVYDQNFIKLKLLINSIVNSEEFKKSNFEISDALTYKYVIPFWKNKNQIKINEIQEMLNSIVEQVDMLLYVYNLEKNFFSDFKNNFNAAA